MKVGSILVLYYPDVTLLEKVLKSLYTQVDKICIIDNSSKCIDNSFFLNYSEINYIQLDRNVGIAAAQNIGLEYFLKLKFDYILFVDQDSVLQNNLVKSLFNATVLLNNRGYNVGVVCPKTINRQDGKPYTEKYKKLDKFELPLLNIEYNFIKVNSCGSSASFISLDNFKKVGQMDEDLFIDGVDNEWCWRAKTKYNLDSFILEDIEINHQLGEGDRSILGLKVAISSPFRIYYQFRNYIILCKRDYVPSEWKYKNGYKYMIKLFYFPLFISPRIKYLSNIYKGIKDGLFFNK